MDEITEEESPKKRRVEDRFHWYHPSRLGPAGLLAAANLLAMLLGISAIWWKNDARLSWLERERLRDNQLTAQWRAETTQSLSQLQRTDVTRLELQNLQIQLEDIRRRLENIERRVNNAR